MLNALVEQTTQRVLYDIFMVQSQHRRQSHSDLCRHRHYKYFYAMDRYNTKHIKRLAAVGFCIISTLCVSGTSGYPQ